MGKILCRNQAGEYISSTAWILQRFCQTENLVLFIFKFTFWKKQTKRFKNKHKKKHPHKFWKKFSISSKIRPEIRFFRFKNDYFGTRSPKWPKFGPKKWISSSRSTLISILMAKSDSTQNFDRGKCYLLGMSPYINDTRALQSFFKSTFSKNHKSQRLTSYGEQMVDFSVYIRSILRISTEIRKLGVGRNSL